MELLNLWLSFSAGLLAPLVAVCVLPLYPGFLAFLASQTRSKRYWSFGLISTAGIISSMLLFGLVFTKLLQSSLTNAIEIVSPLAFVLMAIVGILMLFGIDIGRIFPKIHAPIQKNPYLSSYIFGLFFGLIVLPCNPASLVILFAISTTTLSFISNLFNFIVFGIGMAAPIILLSMISSTKSGAIVQNLAKNKRNIDILSGVIMIAISVYYLIFVFKIQG